MLFSRFNIITLSLAAVVAISTPFASAMLVDPYSIINQGAESSQINLANDGRIHKSEHDETMYTRINNLAPLFTMNKNTEAYVNIDELTARSIKNSYIVVVKPEHIDAHMGMVSSLLVAPLSSGMSVSVDTFNLGSVSGYSISFPEQSFEDVSTLATSIITAIRTSDDVLFVEEDQPVVVSLPTFRKASESSAAVEEHAPWGLGRISSRSPINSTDLTGTYSYFDQDGAGVTAYVVDTGINIEHEDFEGRAVWGATIPKNDFDVDGNGHGTHVAGTIVGSKYGVAKKANVVAVKVLRSSGSGTMADVVHGIEWVFKKHKSEEALAEMKAQKDKKPVKKVRSVANMSLGGGKSIALNIAVNAAVDAGVHFVVAAGNENQDACNVSPASAEKAFTVGATTIDDERAWFSNFGKCLDIFAPGHQILSTWIGSKNATNSISGTSMASPHVAGVFTALLSRKSFENLSLEELRKVVIKVAAKNVVTSVPKNPPSKNRLLYSLPPNVFDDEEVKKLLA